MLQAEPPLVSACSLVDDMQTACSRTAAANTLQILASLVKALQGWGVCERVSHRNAVPDADCTGVGLSEAGSDISALEGLRPEDAAR